VDPHFARRSLVLGLLPALVAACGNASDRATASKTALEGSVVLSPATPVCRAGSPCSKPLPHFELVFMRRGKMAARVQTDSRARYRATLAPGSYAVMTRERGALQPSLVRIRSRRTTVNFKFDSGIR
jgi:hypothetical protein